MTTVNQQSRNAGITAACKLMQDPRVELTKGKRKVIHVPVYEVVLTATKAGGGAHGRASLQIAADEPVKLRIDRGDGQDLVVAPGRPVELKTGPTGNVRVTIDAVGFRTSGRTVLRCPLLKVRSADMPANQWDVVAPDVQAHAELASVSGETLLAGNPAGSGRQATRSPLKAGVSRADADELAAAIRGLMAAAGASALAVDDGGVVAFASDEAANAQDVQILPASGPELAGRVSHADAPLRRVIAAQQLPMPESEVVSFAAGAEGDEIFDVTLVAAPGFAADEDEDELQSFAAGEPDSSASRTRKLKRELRRIDAELAREARKEDREAKKEDREAKKKLRAEKAAQFASELKKFISGAVLQPLEGLVADIFGRAKDALVVVLDTVDRKGVLVRTYQVVVDYGNRVTRAVIDSVESALDVMGAFFEKLGAKCQQIVEFLAALFDWGDILATADGLLSAQRRGLERLPGYINTMRQAWAGLTGSLEASLVKAVDGAVASLQGGQALPPKSPAPKSGNDERSSFLFNKVENSLENMSTKFAFLKPDAKMIAEFEQVFDLKGSLKGIDAPGIWKELKDALTALDVSDMFTSVQEFFSDAASALLVGIKAFLKLLVRVMTVTGDLMLRFVDTLIEAGIKVLNLHLEIPFLTDFIETSILGGRPLTLLTLISVLAAVPFTVAYKLAHGPDQGPFDGAVSFAADADADDKQSKGFDTTAAAYINVVCNFVIGVIVTAVDIADDESAAPRVLKVVSSAAGLLICGVTGIPLDTSDKTAYGLAFTNWIVGLASAAIGIADAAFGLHLTIKGKKNETVEDTFRYVSGGFGLAQLVLALVGAATDTVREKKKPPGERDIDLVWLGAEANILGGLISALPIIPDDPKELKIAKGAVALALIATQTAIGITYCVRTTS